MLLIAFDTSPHKHSIESATDRSRRTCLRALVLALVTLLISMRHSIT